MMSEPLRPMPPHELATNAKGTAKRKIDAFADDASGSEQDASTSKRIKSGAKKARGVALPKGFKMKNMTSSAPGTATQPQSSQPSSSQITLDISPPPPHHPPLPSNPDDRPLPPPKQTSWYESGSPTRLNRSLDNAGKRIKPTSTTGRPPSRQSSVQPIQFGDMKGKGKASVADISTQEELDRLQELRGQIDSLEGGRQADVDRRKGPSQPPSFRQSVAQTPSHPTSLSARPPDSARTPLPYPVPSPTFAGQSSSGSPTARNGLHASTSTVPVPLTDTPMISRNREMRREQSERRKSSMGQASMRVSESFGAGILANPHPSVESPKFYTHIASELPEALRIRQLLAWCASRALSGPSAGSAQARQHLPPLSKTQDEFLHEVQDEFMKSLCLGKVDTSITLDDASGTPGRKRKKLKEHPRNIINKAQEVVFLKQEADANVEETAWSEVVQGLNSMQANTLNSLERRREKRRALEEEFKIRWERDLKGKSKDSMEVDEGSGIDAQNEARILSRLWDVETDAFSSEHDTKFLESMQLVEHEFSLRASGTTLDDDEQVLVERMEKLEPLVEDIHAGTHAARVLAEHSHSFLAAFSKALASRFNSRIHPPGGARRSDGRSGSPSGPSITSLLDPSTSTSTTSPMSKLGVLSTAKPLEANAEQSDAAKRVAMDLERGVGERRYTAIPATPSRRTPRKSAGRNGR